MKMGYNCIYFLIFSVFVHLDEVNSINLSDTQTCIDLCTSCNGIATFQDNQCVCNVEGRLIGSECVNIMKREAKEIGMEFESCDQSDQRTIRCVASPKYDQNGIQQVAKYFLKEGPVVGASIFQAPLYTNPSERNSGCTESSNVITQPPSTIKDSTGCSPAQVFSNPDSENVGSPQLITQPKETLPSKTVPKPTSPKFEIPKLSFPKIGSQRLVNPNTANPVLGSPRVNTEQQPCTCGENVGSPQIITQPKESLPISKTVPKPASPKFEITKLSFPKIGSQRLVNPNTANPLLGSPRVNTEQQSCTCGNPIVGSTNSENLAGFPSFTPLFMQLLGAHLGQPLLGIPQAIQTIGSTPGVGELVGAPATILKAFFGQCKDATPLSSSIPPENYDQSSPQEFSSEDPTVGSSIMDNNHLDEDNSAPNTGSANADSQSTLSYTKPVVSYPIMSSYYPINTINPGYTPDTNPTVGASTPTQFSIMNPTVGAPPPIYVSHVMVHNPMTGNPNPFVSNLPVTTTYLLGSPFPYYSNYNPIYTSNPIIKTEKSPSEENVALAYPNNDGIIEKKICRKSVKQEVSRKLTRDVKSYFENESSEQIELNFENEKNRIKYATTEIPKIDRTTTQSPSKNKSIEEKHNIERFFLKTKSKKKEDDKKETILKSTPEIPAIEKQTSETLSTNNLIVMKKDIPNKKIKPITEIKQKKKMIEKIKLEEASF